MFADCNSVHSRFAFPVGLCSSHVVERIFPDSLHSRFVLCVFPRQETKDQNWNFSNYGLACCMHVIPGHKVAPTSLLTSWCIYLRMLLLPFAAGNGDCNCDGAYSLCLWAACGGSMSGSNVPCGGEGDGPSTVNGINCSN